MEVTILKSTSKEVIVQVLSLTGDSADVNITWANLSELFDHPDAPGGITGGSVTGERQRGKDKLVCKTVSWTNNEDGANGPEMAITWVNGSLLYACPDDAGSHTFSGAGLLTDASSIHATDAVLCSHATAWTPDADEYMRIEMTFGTSGV